jgi:hypothetical protein
MAKSIRLSWYLHQLPQNKRGTQLHKYTNVIPPNPTFYHSSYSDTKRDKHISFINIDYEIVNRSSWPSCVWKVFLPHSICSGCSGRSVIFRTKKLVCVTLHNRGVTESVYSASIRRSANLRRQHKKKQTEIKWNQLIKLSNRLFYDADSL